MPAPTNTDSLEKLYYSISEVVEQTGVPAPTLRFWEREFRELKPHRTPKGQRKYSAKDVETINLLYYLLKEKGLKIEAAKIELRKNREGVDRRHQTIERLRDIRATLCSLLEAVKRP